MLGISYKKTLMVALVICILAFTNYFADVSASPSSYNVKLSTGDLSLGRVLTFRLDYSFIVEVSHPEVAQKAQQVEWQASVSGGKVIITVVVESSVPVIGGQTFTREYSLGIGREISIPVTTGLSLMLSATATAPVQVMGPASSNVKSLSWSSEGTKSFRLKVADSAKDGEEITVSMPFSVVLTAGATLNLLILKQQITSRELGSFSASPVVSESMFVGSAPIAFSPLLIGAGVAIPVITIASILMLRRRALRKRKPAVPVARKAFCGKCGARIDPDKRFCGKCGARIS